MGDKARIGVRKDFRTCPKEACTSIKSVRATKLLHVGCIMIRETMKTRSIRSLWL